MATDRTKPEETLHFELDPLDPANWSGQEEPEPVPPPCSVCGLTHEEGCENYPDCQYWKQSN